MYLTNKKKYQLLYDISQQVRDTLDLDEIMDHLLDAVKTVVDYDAAGIFVLNQDLVYDRREQPKEVIAGVARRGFDPKPPEEDAMLSQGRGIIGYVISTGSSLVIPDVSLDLRYIEGRSRTRSEITVPIVRNKRAIGALNLESDQLAAFDEDDLDVLQFFADAASISIEKAMLHRQLVAKELLDKQLELARDLQSQLFPKNSPQIPGYDIAGICLPAEEIGGDYYDFIPLRRGRLGVAIADISGNGIASALVMTAFRGLLRIHTQSSQRLEKIACAINRQLPEFTAGSQYVTALYALLNPVTDEFTFVNCGHHPPMLIHPDGSTDSLHEHGPALGIIENVAYPINKTCLNPGDIMVLYTDGAVEISNKDGVEIGYERLRVTIHRNRDLPADTLIQRVIQTAREFSGFQRFPDDFTLVIIKRLS
ncbi:MAG TPA: GAF domain-containing SpoIIE family protein phosphatase [Anaerolineales bacterium]|nr:GAF domain-containing SpoIIE family protein phosphatase [Anaerolineales bacterium]